MNLGGDHYYVVGTSDNNWELFISKYSVDKILMISRLIEVNGLVKRFYMIHDAEDQCIDVDFKVLNLLLKTFIGNCINNETDRIWFHPGHDELKFCDIFIETTNNPSVAYLYQANCGIQSLTKENNSWITTNSFLFSNGDFTTGEEPWRCVRQSASPVIQLSVTESIKPKDRSSLGLIEPWEQRLNDTIGSAGVKIKANRFDEVSCVISSIEFSKFNLTFHNFNNRLMSSQFNGYYLSDKKGLKEIPGFASLILLENSMGSLKIIIPAYCVGSSNPQFENRNRIFSGEFFIDNNALLFKDPSQNSGLMYFTYEINTNGFLKGNSVEADFYLAIIYRGLGDYSRAMKSLSFTQHHQNNSIELSLIADQILQFQDLSPSGAAFDCQLFLRLQSHSKKWSKTPNHCENIFEPLDPMHIHFVSQFAHYNQSVSARKEDVYIIPNYLRLRSEQINILKKYLPLGWISNDRLISTKSIDCLLKSNRFMLPPPCNSYFLTKKIQSSDLLSSLPMQLRILPIRKSKQSEKHPSLSFLKTYYLQFYNIIRENNPDDIKLIKARLFFLLHSEPSQIKRLKDAITSLFILIALPDLFKDLGQFESEESCYKAIYNRFHNDKSFKRYQARFEKENIFDLVYQNIPLQHASNEELALPNPLLIYDEINFSTMRPSLTAISFYPLKNIILQFFNIEMRPVAIKDFQLAGKLSADVTSLERHLFDHYHSGHLENQIKTKRIYSFISEQTLESLQSLILEQKAKDIFKLEAYLEAVLDYANDTASSTSVVQPDASDLLNIARKGKQIHKIKLEDLILSLLTNDFSEITKLNLFLTKEKLAMLMSHVCDLMILQSRIYQMSEALELIGDAKNINELNSYKLQLLGSVLDKQRPENHLDYPEFLVYEYLTKRMIRPDQSIALMRLIQLIENNDVSGPYWQHALLQFAAGGGKTALITPILSFRISKKGFLPVIFNTNELYSIGIEDIPESFKACFQQKMQILEVELEHKWPEW